MHTDGRQILRSVCIMRSAVVIFCFAPILAAAEDCSALLDRAQKAFDAQQFAVAAADLDAALGKCPIHRVRIRTALGQTNYLLGKDVEAEQVLLAALKEEPN